MRPNHEYIIKARKGGRHSLAVSLTGNTLISDQLVLLTEDYNKAAFLTKLLDIMSRVGEGFPDSDLIHIDGVTWVRFTVEWQKSCMKCLTKERLSNIVRSLRKDGFLIQKSLKVPSAPNGSLWYTVDTQQLAKGLKRLYRVRSVISDPNWSKYE